MVNTANADLKYKNRTYTRTLFVTIDNTVILIPKHVWDLQFHTYNLNKIGGPRRINYERYDLTP